MRLKITLKKLITFLGLVLVPTISYSADLITNGSFSQQFSGWNFVEYTSGSHVTMAKEGSNNIVKLHHDSIKDWCSIYQEVASKLTKGQIYRFSYRYKTSGVDKKYLSIGFADVNSTTHSSSINNAYGDRHLLISDNKWHTDSFIFLVNDSLPKADEPVLSIFPNYGTAGDIFIDNVSITLADNKSFEAATYDKATKVFYSPNVIEN